MASACRHLRQIAVTDTHQNVCAECVQLGDPWVHLRLCMVCGHVGCCDELKNRHATRHYQHTAHPLIRSIEPRRALGLVLRRPDRRRRTGDVILRHCAGVASRARRCRLMVPDCARPDSDQQVEQRERPVPFGGAGMTNSSWRRRSLLSMSSAAALPGEAQGSDTHRRTAPRAGRPAGAAWTPCRNGAGMSSNPNGPCSPKQVA